MDIKITSLKDLNPAAYNPRQIDDAALTGLKYSLTEFGDLSGIVFNARTGSLVAGHQRIKALTAEYGDLEIIDNVITLPDGSTFQIRIVDWDELKEKAANITANNPALQGKFTSSLRLMVNEINLEIPDLAKSLRINEIRIPDPVRAMDESKLDEIPAVKKHAISQLGDQFLLNGKHRLQIGDSTVLEDVAALMAGKQSDMTFTDPPYNLDYTGGLSPDPAGGLKSNDRERIKNDDVDLYPEAIPMMAKFCDGAIYTWFADTEGESIYKAINKVGQIHSLLIWIKNGGYGALNANYKQKHETCLYWKRKNKTLKFIGETTETTIWQIDKDGLNDLHPTQKPVALALKAIRNHKAELIMDLFLGAGSTLVAAEYLGRTCYGQELKPIYMDVTLRRFRNLFPEAEIHCLNRDFNFKKLFGESK